MAQNDPTPTQSSPSTTYRLRVQGRPPARLAEELTDFTIDAGPSTTLTGPVADPAALYGLIARLESLGLTLLSVHPSPSPAATPPSAQQEGGVASSDQEHDGA
jgi:hypothetical protein